MQALSSTIYFIEAQRTEGIYETQKLEVGTITLCSGEKQCSPSDKCVQIVLGAVECRIREQVGSHGNNGSVWEKGIMCTTENFVLCVLEGLARDTSSRDKLVLSLH